MRAETRETRVGRVGGTGIPGLASRMERLLSPPLWTGALLALGFFAVFALYARAFGLPFWHRMLEYELLHGAMVGYAAMIAGVALRGAERDLHDLRPVLRGGAAEQATRLTALLHLDRRVLVGAVLVGAVLGVLVALDPRAWEGDGAPAMGDPILAWVVAKLVLLFAIIVRSATLEIVVALRFSRIGRRETTSGLLELRPLAPFVRHGLRSTGMWMGLTLLVSLLFFQDYARELAPINVVATTGIALLLLLLPVIGVHRRLRELKRDEHERLREAIEAERELLLSGRPGEPPAGAERMPSLIAYQGLVDTASTWPFDLSTWVRFGLYIALGLGSWLGAAFVERGLDVFLR